MDGSCIVAKRWCFKTRRIVTVRQPPIPVHARVDVVRFDRAACGSRCGAQVHNYFVTLKRHPSSLRASAQSPPKPFASSKCNTPFITATCILTNTSTTSKLHVSNLLVVTLSPRARLSLHPPAGWECRACQQLLPLPRQRRNL